MFVRWSFFFEKLLGGAIECDNFVDKRLLVIYFLYYINFAMRAIRINVMKNISVHLLCKYRLEFWVKHTYSISHENYDITYIDT